ncbi:N-6 DNA methylase [Elizabethkingia anophelis]|uniref:N-6 DNA methylase n=1 Tax=Elizabethkingia anophelis TaxID=1117645 RepID=UPI00222760A6|nr:N-6 DNA methylase [Elizabethkingia anophelis]MCW2465060.1 type I restriction enzyme M protein [Elizabethkingia anophelis]MCW2468789.1 type I restriction enzyme M protein [Elizabethkingia anophelis]MCW2472427.1 type I restriction enzyme M protein [Elizabethkingia anophelis]HBI9693043.1 N-6 DNA methylase [Elizabethkingia anophelis]HBI9697063.1 N-6 DNA methylase [Elizabethkingia anophelis]
MEVQIKENKIFAPLKDKWLVLKPEEEVRQNYIVRLINSYGFELNQMAQEVQVNNSQRGQGRAMADIVIWKSEVDKLADKSPVIVIECKAEHITIHEEDYFQGYNYASWAGADFFVTTNEKETRIFKVVKGLIPKRLEEIVNIPNAKEIKSDKKIDELLKQTKAFTRDEFSKLLFKCHNIIRNNDKLSPEAAFDEISKILFIKIRYERANSEHQIFSEDAFKADKASYEKYKPKDGKDFYQFLFDQTKEDFKDDDLFEPTEILRIRENSFEAIVKELQIYNLSTTSDDVKGIAFEQFLGRTFRGELGQFFTPRTVVDFMVDVLDPQEGETICDPCCGSGGFLIKAFEYVRTKIEEEIQVAKDKIKEQYYTEAYDKLSEKAKAKVDDQVTDLFAKLNAELDINNPKSRLRVLSYDCIFGTDANPRMSRTAKMNMIMHGDGHGGVHHNDGLLNVNGIFENRFDVILTNPPFGARVEKTLKITEADKYTDVERILKYRKRYGSAYDEALKQVNNNISKPLLNLYETGKMSTLTEVLFIERCLNLLRPGGRMGVVLPEGVLNNTNLQKVRDFVEGKAKIILITSIPQDVFIASGATVKPSLLFFKKFTEEEQKEYNNIVKEANRTVKENYVTRLKEIKEALAKKGKEALAADEKKALKAEQKAIEAKIETEIKAQVKEKFNYQIPIAEVEKAGISTTGAKIENDLEPLAEEFKQYRTENKLWQTLLKDIQYEVIDNQIYRIPVADNNIVTEPEIFYN